MEIKIKSEKVIIKIAKESGTKRWIDLKRVLKVIGKSVISRRRRVSNKAKCRSA